MSRPNTVKLKKLFADKFGLNLDEDENGLGTDGTNLAKAFSDIVNFSEDAASPVSETRFFEVLFRLFNEPDLRDGLYEYLSDCEFHRIASQRAREQD